MLENGHDTPKNIAPFDRHAIFPALVGIGKGLIILTK
jgi:hypothetical protein